MCLRSSSTVGLFSGMCKGDHSSTVKKTNNPIKKWAKALPGRLSTRDTHVPSEQVKKRFLLLVFRELQIRATLRNRLSSVRMVTSKKKSRGIPWWPSG